MKTQIELDQLRGKNYPLVEVIVKLRAEDNYEGGILVRIKETGEIKIIDYEKYTWMLESGAWYEHCSALYGDDPDCDHEVEYEIEGEQYEWFMEATKEEVYDDYTLTPDDRPGDDDPGDEDEPLYYRRDV